MNLWLISILKWIHYHPVGLQTVFCLICTWRPFILPMPIILCQLRQKFQEYLKNQSEGVLYQYTCLPNHGLASAHREFTKFGQACVCLLGFSRTCLMWLS